MGVKEWDGGKVREEVGTILISVCVCLSVSVCVSAFMCLSVYVCVSDFIRISLSHYVYVVCVW